MSKPPRPQARRTLAPQPDPPGIRASKYDWEFGFWICRRIARGESIRSICRSDPAMPTAKTLWNWARAHPEFAIWKAQALAIARERALEGRTAPSRSRKTGRRAWNAGLDGYALLPDVADAVLAELCEGRALMEVCRTEPWAPSVGTFYNWLKRYPALLAEYRLCKAASCMHVEAAAREDLPWLGSYRASVRAAKAADRAGRRRAAKLAMKRYAETKGRFVAAREVDMTLDQPQARGPWVVLRETE